MKCKFCDADLDHLGSIEKECCSWCQAEMPYHSKICWVCEGHLEFEGGVASCKCGMDYITQEGHKMLDNCYNHYMGAL